MENSKYTGMVGDTGDGNPNIIERNTMTKVKPGYRLAIPLPEHPCPKHGIRQMRYNFKTKIRQMRYNFKTKFYICLTPMTTCGYRSK